MKNILTVGDLKKALEDIPDDTLIARRGHHGDNWVNGFQQIGYIELATLGRKKIDRLTVATENPFYGRWNGYKSEPFKAVAFD
jgi:hypothetical protein